MLDISKINDDEYMNHQKAISILDNKITQLDKKTYGRELHRNVDIISESESWEHKTFRTIRTNISLDSIIDPFYLTELNWVNSAWRKFILNKLFQSESERKVIEKEMLKVLKEGSDGMYQQ